MRTGRRFLWGAGVVVAAVVAAPGIAVGSSVGCTSAGGDTGFDQVCLEIKGDGLKVDSFKVGMSDCDLKGPVWVPAAICNHFATPAMILT